MKRDLGYLCLIFMVAFLLRDQYMLTHYYPMSYADLRGRWPDEYTYYTLAHQMSIDGFWKFFSNEMSIWTAPMNPIFIFLMHKLSINDIYLIRIFNILQNSLLVYVFYAIGKRLGSSRVGLVSAAIYAIYLPFVPYSASLLTEPIFVATLSIGVLLALKAIDEGKTYLYILAGLVFGITALIRSNVMLFPFFLLFFVAIGFWRRRISSKLVKGAVVFSISVIIVILPVMLKNQVVFHKFTISTGAGAVLYLGSRVDTQGDEPPLRKAGYDTDKITGEYNHLQIEGDQRLMDVAKENIKNNLFQYLYFDFKKIGRLLIGSNLAWWDPYNNLLDYYHQFGFKPTIRSLVDITLTTLIVVFGFSGVWRLVRTASLKGIFISLYIFYHIIFSIPFLVNTRYGYPILLFLIVLAIYELSHIKLLLKTKRELFRYTAFRSMIVCLILWSVVGGWVIYFK